MEKVTDSSLLNIEKAHMADVEAIVQLFVDAAVWMKGRGIYQWTTSPRPSFWEHVRQKIAEGEVFVVRAANGRLLGHIRFDYEAGRIWYDEPADTAYVRGLVIANKMRGQGLGAEMLDWAQGYAQQKGHRRLRLDCLAENGRLCQYYHDYGFTFLGEGYSGSYTAALYEMMLA
jgi:GNAT superfamily N-acetyltransferase